MPTERRAENLAKFALNIAALCVAIVALLFHVDQMFLMAVALLLLPRASWLIGRVLRDGLTGARRLPTLCGVGETVPVTLTLTNSARLSKPSLRLSDRLPRRLRPAGERAPVLLGLRPRESREVTYSLEPERRGRYLVGPTLVETTDPLGFYAFMTRVGGQSELSVYPMPLPLRRVFLEGAAAPGWRSQDAARLRGIGTEFHGVREYQSGDELRHVHWRTTARRGALSVAEYAQGANRDVVVALDLSRAAYADTGEGRESALEYAVTLAVSLCDFLLRRGRAVRLLTPMDGDDPAPPSSGPAQLPRILDVLVDAEADAPQSLAEALAGSRLRLEPGTTLVYITPAVGDPALAAALRAGAARGAQVFGLALDGPSFRAASPPAESPMPTRLPGSLQRVRRGDDLQRVLEG